MQKADTAVVDWDAEKKHWTVRVTIGEEVIKRTLEKTPEDTNDDVLKTAAMKVAVDEGYEFDPADVTVSH